ncbi:MAG: FixH family protein [Thermodesulfovibrionales bacterium]|jgi:hypothetical protein
MNVKGLAAVTLILLVVASIAYAKDYELTKKAGEYTVEVKIDKNPPVVGDNITTVEIKDASGKYVTDAKVVVNYSMPAMMGMPVMNYKADAELKGSEYKAKMVLSMAGSWNVEVRITRAGKTVTAKFTVDAQ